MHEDYKQSTQPTLFSFFKPKDGKRPIQETNCSPNASAIGAKLYSKAMVDSVTGTEKTRRDFFNMKFEKLCSNRTISRWPKSAITGAVHVAWRLYKTGILYSQAQSTIRETEHANVKQKRDTILANVDRMLQAHKEVMLLNDALIFIKSDARVPEKLTKAEEYEKQMTGRVTHLKNAQEALRKAIEVRQKQANVKVEERSTKFEEG